MSTCRIPSALLKGSPQAQYHKSKLFYRCLHRGPHASILEQGQLVCWDGQSLTVRQYLYPPRSTYSITVLLFQVVYDPISDRNKNTPPRKRMARTGSVWLVFKIWNLEVENWMMGYLWLFVVTPFVNILSYCLLPIVSSETCGWTLDHWSSPLLSMGEALLVIQSSFVSHISIV